MYQIERQDQLYKTLPQALFFSPTMVVFSALTLLLPLSGVFAPGSLTVTTKKFPDIGPCMLPAGNLSTVDTPDDVAIGLMNYPYPGNGSSPLAESLNFQWFVEKHIPDLPQACGPNCRYKVHLPSFVFQCTPNPSSLPYGQGVDTRGGTTLWNGTVGPNHLGFYIAWQSNGPNGTWGNALCAPVQAQYDVEVWRIAFSTSLLLIFYMSTQGPDKRRCPIFYDKHNANGFSHLRARCYKPTSKP